MEFRVQQKPRRHAGNDDGHDQHWYHTDTGLHGPDRSNVFASAHAMFRGGCDCVSPDGDEQAGPAAALTADRLDYWIRRHVMPYSDRAHPSQPELSPAQDRRVGLSAIGQWPKHQSISSSTVLMVISQPLRRKSDLRSSDIEIVLGHSRRIWDTARREPSASG